MMRSRRQIETSGGGAYSEGLVHVANRRHRPQLDHAQGKTEHYIEDPL